jgi:hypothetical protein
MKLKIEEVLEIMFHHIDRMEVSQEIRVMDQAMQESFHHSETTTHLPIKELDIVQVVYLMEAEGIQIQSISII